MKYQTYTPFKMYEWIKLERPYKDLPDDVKAMLTALAITNQTVMVCLGGKNMMFPHNLGYFYRSGGIKFKSSSRGDIELSDLSAMMLIDIPQSDS